MNNAPELVGAYGEAWRVDVNQKGPMDWSSTLTVWIIKAPGQGDSEYYYLSAIHLRDIPGVPPAKKEYPDAEYEITLMAIEPGVVPDGKSRVPLDTKTCAFYQFHALSDKQVVHLVKLCAHAVVDGNLPAETRIVSLDFGDPNRAPWIDRWLGSGLKPRQVWVHMIVDTIDYITRGH